jgi:hypothetical protein
MAPCLSLSLDAAAQQEGPTAAVSPILIVSVKHRVDSRPRLPLRRLRTEIRSSSILIYCLILVFSSLRSRRWKAVRNFRNVTMNWRTTLVANLWRRFDFCWLFRLRWISVHYVFQRVRTMQDTGFGREDLFLVHHFYTCLHLFVASHFWLKMVYLIWSENQSLQRVLYTNFKAAVVR